MLLVVAGGGDPPVGEREACGMPAQPGRDGGAWREGGADIGHGRPVAAHARWTAEQ